MEPPYTVVESDSVQICLQLQGSSRRNVLVNVDFEDLNTSSADYTNTAMTIVFASGSQNQCFNLVTNTDDIFENDETLSIILRTTDSGVNIGADTSLVTISDSSIISVGFTTVSQAAVEGENVTVCIDIVSGRLAEQVTLSLSVSISEGQSKLRNTVETSLIKMRSFTESS